MEEFNLCVIYDSGVQEFLSDEDYPLQKRLKLGPNEDIAKIYLVEAHTAKEEQLTEEVREEGGKEKGREGRRGGREGDGGRRIEGERGRDRG